LIVLRYWRDLNTKVEIATEPVRRRVARAYRVGPRGKPRRTNFEWVHDRLAEPAESRLSIGSFPACRPVEGAHGRNVPTYEKPVVSMKMKNVD
jgi:hypothetical protein